MSYSNFDRACEIWHDFGSAVPPKMVDGQLVRQMDPLFNRRISN